MRPALSRLAFLCVLGSSPVLSALQTQPVSAMPPDSFKFAGAWACEGTFQGGKAHTATFTAQIILGNKWIELTEEDVQPATGYLAKYLIGYDGSQNRVVEFDANNFGAATYSSEQGWQNQVLTMTSPVSTDAKAAFAANRFMYSITGADGFTVDWQISRSAQLNWLTADHLACKRKSNP